jgi:hypothetical protein
VNRGLVSLHIEPWPVGSAMVTIVLAAWSHRLLPGTTASQRRSPQHPDRRRRPGYTDTGPAATFDAQPDRSPKASCSRTHTAPMCAPTRAMPLTGINNHGDESASRSEPRDSRLRATCRSGWRCSRLLARGRYTHSTAVASGRRASRARSRPDSSGRISSRTEPRTTSIDRPEGAAVPRTARSGVSCGTYTTELLRSADRDHRVAARRWLAARSLRICRTGCPGARRVADRYRGRYDEGQ